MGVHGTNRRAILRERGRPMTMRRAIGTSGVTVTLLGFARAFSPGELTGGVQQGDLRIETLADEITGAAWPAPPRNPDRVTMDNRTWTVQGAWPVYEGAELIGWTIWARGG